MASSRFALARAAEDDMDELVDLEFRVFTNKMIRDVFMGSDTPAGRLSLCQTRIKAMREDPNDCWIKVVDTSTKRIIGASNWKICPTNSPPHEPELSLDWLQGERLEQAKDIWQHIVEVRKTFMVGAYVQLHICYTDPIYQRQGVGSMMLEWGCELADHLFVPSWVEASPTGNHLYKLFGYEQVNAEGESGLDGSLMKRLPRMAFIEGGKALP